MKIKSNYSATDHSRIPHVAFYLYRFKKLYLATDLHRKKQKYEQKELCLKKDSCRHVGTNEHKNNPPIPPLEKGGDKVCLLFYGG